MQSGEARSAVVLAAALFIHGGAARAASEAIAVALPGDFPTLDPSKDSSPIGFNYRLNVFDALTELRRDGGIEARLAESWTFSPDLTEWTFRLRQGVTFHDGSPFTADDVVFTIERIKADNTSPVRTFIRLVDKVEKLDSFTVRFKLNQPYAIFHRQISYVNLMSKTYFDKVGDQGYATKPVGTGPYRLIKWSKDDRTELEANASYWRGAPAIKRATFRPIPSGSARAAALLSGEIDLVPALAPALIGQLKSRADLDVATAPSFSRGVRRVQRQQAAARQRESARGDRRRDRPVSDHGQASARARQADGNHMVPPMNIGYDPSFKPVAYDPQRAKQLVAESGYDGTPIAIQYPGNNIVMANEVVQAIAGYMTAAGLKVEIKPMEFTAFFPLWLQAKLDSMYFFAFGSTQFHAESVLATMYEQGARAYKVDMEIDALLKKQRTLVDPAEQTKVIAAAFRKSNENRYQLPLYDEMQAYGAKKTVGYAPAARRL